MFPVSMTGTVLTLFSQNIIQQSFKNNPNQTNISVKIHLLSPDDYGNNKSHVISSFNFSRNQYNKVNWDNITADKFIKISKLNYSPWFIEKADEEASQ